MLTVTAVSDADYYLRSQCHREALVASASDGPAAYELAAMAAGEPPGRWYFPGRNDLAVEGEIHAEGPSAERFRQVVNDLRHPVSGEALGRRPFRFASIEERMARFDATNPAATPEQRAAALVRAEATKRTAVHAWDLTFSLPKSWSVLHAALQRAGRADEAEAVWAAARAGIEAALAQAASELGWTRTGPGGPKVAGRSTTTYVRAEDWQTAIFAHHTSRERDPQLHAHVMVSNRVLCSDGTWRALYSPAFTKSKHQLDATFLRVAEAELTRSLGIRFATRPDGKAREIVGVPAAVADLFSVRSRAVDELTQQKLDDYAARYGVAPPPLVRWRLGKESTLQSRRAKPAAAPSREQDLDRWESQVAQEFREGLGWVVDEVDQVRGLPDEPIVVPPLEPQLVIAQALADLEERKATWNRSHLYHAISQRMPDMLAIEPARIPAVMADLTDAALAGREAVCVGAPPVAPVPRSLTDQRTGRSVFEAPDGDRWTTAGHLAREDGLVERLEHRGAPVLSQDTARALLADAGLSGAQLATAMAIATSQRRVELVDDAAGTGKTTLMAALSRASHDAWGHGITGFAVAENAAQNLAEHGVDRGHNITAWLEFRDRAGRGAVSDLERAAFAVPRGAMVVVDEASMVDTPRLTRLVAALESAGVGKIVLIGDTQQVDAIDAGGAFAMLCEQREPHRLGEVRRFTAGWERDASVGLRAGDVDVLTQYDARARVHGKTDRVRLEEAIVRAFLADHLDGLDSVIVVGTQDAADTVSSRVREQLVRAGEVERDGVALASQHTTAGIGDLVQTRRNDRSLGVANRDVWQVVGISSAGDLEVRRAEGRGPDGDRRWGAVRTLPSTYVRKDVELAYAGTVHAVQGRTTDTGHLLTDRMMGRSAAYPGMTRGRSANHAWVLLEGEETPLGRLAQIVETDDRTQAARVAIAAEQDRADHLGHLGPQWQTLVTESRSQVHASVIRCTLDPAEAQAVLADPASSGVLRMLRQAESAGFDLAAVLARAMESGSLAGARSPASVLFARLDDVLPAGTVAGARPFTYLDRTPIGHDERSLYAREIATAMDARARMLGERTADEAPQWAVDRWGEPPADPVERLAWCGRAAPVAAYREQHGWDHERNPIGPQPTRAEPERLWAWNRAADTLGMDPHEREMAALSVGELANRCQQWEREQAWMPRNVDHDMREAHAALDEARAQIVDARTRGDDPVGEVADETAMRERVAWLEEIAAARARAYRATEDLRDRAQEARVELERRQDLEVLRADVLEPEAPDAEQTAAAHAAVFERLAPGAELVDVPAFGSRAWAELVDEDPRKAAATTRAAARWWNLGEPLDRDLAATYERLAEHEQAQVDGRFELRKREREASDDTGPDYVLDHAVQWEAPPERGADVETLAAVRSWSAPHLTAGDAPEFGSAEWAGLEDRATADAAEARAAMRWFNLGDNLDEVHERARVADDVASSHAIAAAAREHGSSWVDARPHAEVARARGDEVTDESLPRVVEREVDEPALDRDSYRGLLDAAARVQQPAEVEEPEPEPRRAPSIQEDLERARAATRLMDERELAARDVAPPEQRRAEPERELAED